MCCEGTGGLGVRHASGKAEPVKPAPFVGPQPQGFGAGVLKNRKAAAQPEALTSLFSDIGNKAGEVLGKAQLAGQGMLQRGQLQVDWLGGVVKNAFTKDPITTEQQPADQIHLAGAMQKGSAEAFSTIVRSMFGGDKDPNVKATKQQTKDLAKVIKAAGKQPFKIVPEFAT